MIYCPICGTANRDRSKYCNECGVKFDPPKQKCPKCGALNPVEHLACADCGEGLPSQPPLIPDVDIFQLDTEEEPAPIGEAAAVPEWLKDLPVPVAAEIPQATEIAEEDREVERPGEFDLPAEEPALEAQSGPTGSDPAGEGEDLLDSLQDTLPAAALVAQQPDPPSNTPEARAAGSVDAEDSAVHDQFFGELISPSPAAVTKAASSSKAQQLPVLPRWILYALLIAAVSLPFLFSRPLLSLLKEAWWPASPLPLVRTSEASLAVAGLHAQIESLDRDAAVLVAFDYDPSTLGEMDLLAQVVVRHLMQRDARVVAVSLLPAGPATAQGLLDSVAADVPGYLGAYGRRYVNLGYLPGQAAAIRLLGHSLQTALPRDFQGRAVVDLEVMDGITAIPSFDLIVVFSASQDTLRGWIEQAGAPYDVPLGAAVSAAVEPLARPYYETGSRQLVGLVAGVQGAAQYRDLRTRSLLETSALRGSDQNQDGESLDLGVGPPTRTQAAEARFDGSLTRRLDGQLAGLVVFVLVIVVGNAVYLVRRVMGRGL